MASDLAALIMSLEKAKEGSREFDAKIDHWLEGWAHERSTSPLDSVPGDPSTITLPTVPKFTTDLSAAVALCDRVLPKWEWGIDAGWHGDEPSIVAYVGEAVPDGVIGHDWQAQGPNPALALCIAILRAKAYAHD